MNSRKQGHFFGLTAQSKPAVMISACLLGEPVRYDGNSKRLATLPLLQAQLSLISCCPEVGAGLAVSRPPVQLVNTADGLLVRGRDDPQLDVTRALQRFSQASVAACDSALCGYVLKSRSPSCGLGSTPLFDEQGREIGLGDGIQAQQFLQRKPWLIFADDNELANEDRCRRFIQRCRVIGEALQCPPSELRALQAHYGLSPASDCRQEVLRQLKAWLVGDCS